MNEQINKLVEFCNYFFQVEYETSMKRIDLNLPNEKYAIELNKLMPFFHAKLKKDANDITGYWGRTSDWCTSPLIRQSIEESKRDGERVAHQLKQIQIYKNPYWGSIYKNLKSEELYVCAITTLKPVVEDKFNRIFVIKNNQDFIIIYYDKSSFQTLSEIDYLTFDMNDCFISLGDKIAEIDF